MAATEASQALAVTILTRCLPLSAEECAVAHSGTTAEWDSFAHLEIVVEVEERFGRQLTLDEIEGIVDAASLATLIDALGRQA